MKNAFFLGITLLILCSTACKDREDDMVSETLVDVDFTSIDHVVFGWFYGECVGETCVEIFKITPDAIFEDSFDRYPLADLKIYEGFYNLYNVPPGVPDVNYSQIESVIDSFPRDLVMETETILGTPDATDGGGIYIELKSGSYREFWILDQIKDNVPEYLHDYMSLVNFKIAILSNP